MEKKCVQGKYYLSASKKQGQSCKNLRSTMFVNLSIIHKSKLNNDNDNDGSLVHWHYCANCFTKSGTDSQKGSIAGITMPGYLGG